MAELLIERIVIRFINHSQQRYPTVGDWELIDNTLIITVSRMSDKRRMLLIAMHELTEAIICYYQGITQEQVDAFDIKFEQEREEGNAEEPGGDPQAPYHDAHKFAERFEKDLAAKLEVDWQSYENEVNSL